MRSRHRLPTPRSPRPSRRSAEPSHLRFGLVNAEDPRPARRRKLRSVSIKALPAMQLEIDKYYLRLCGIRTRQLAGRRTPIANGNVRILLARSILMEEEHDKNDNC